MKLHLMASFRTHFRLNDEEVLASPDDYQEFWRDVAEETAADLDNSFGNVKFLHKVDVQDGQLSRFRSVSTDSLFRPLQIIEVGIDPDDSLPKLVWGEVLAKFSTHEDMLTKVKLISESISVRIYNNSVALLQADMDIYGLIENQLKEGLAGDFDVLQEFGVTLGEQLSRSIYHEYLYKFLHGVSNGSSLADRFISCERFDYESAKLNAILTEESSKDKQIVRVNWVTRTILVESEDERNLAAIITHWLKDCGDQKLIERAMKEPDVSAIRWLNYLFREKAYTWITKEDGAIDYAKPFADEWQAMLNAQYYYATFEAINDSLTSTLAHSYRESTGKGIRNTGALRELSHKLERDIINANLATLEYHNNFGYYKRKVGSTMKEIMNGWDFDEAILDEVKRKTELCEQRVDELHKKAESRSGFYSDLLLLGIALVSISAFLFQIIEYGRTMSHNAELAVYESNSWNLIKLISERPTDFIITLSLALIIVLFALYAWFRRLKVMD